MNTVYTKRELAAMETIEQAWDGDELKVYGNSYRVWLVIPENRQYSGDYVIEVLDPVSGRWEQESYYFN
jgi:hypothetical protein